MIDVLFTLLIATSAGLFAGLMPGIGSSAIMLSSLPLLYILPPELCIFYYALAVQSSQFSGSVSALNFGMMGELTSYPALVERKYILNNNLQQTALKFTAIGSILSCVVPILCLYPLLEWFKQHSLIMRTDFTFFILLVIIFFCILYKKNSKKINLFLVSIGIILSQIGLRSQGSAEREFLTFGQPFMYGGIPMISVLGGLIAIPLIMQYMNWQEEISYTYKSKEKKDINFPVWSSIRGGLIGLFTGLLPAIGTQIGSNLAWRIEKIFYSKNNDKSVLSRLTSAESANNGSQITVLVPLLILGIAIVPSEMILLSIIDTKSWIPGQSSWTLLGFGFYPWLMITLIMSSFICYLVCSVFVNLISKWLKDKLKFINKICILIMSLSVFYAGYLVEAKTFFMLSFLTLSLIGIKFKKIDFIPLIAGYFIGDILIDTIVILSFIYEL